MTMLYIFDVLTGSMITFDIKFAFQSVAHLKEEIKKTLDIRINHQVLLMSGGGKLENNVLISSYSTGTDCNPVYLFRKDIKSIKNESALSLSSSFGDCEENYKFQKMIEESATMPADYKTLLARTQMAQEFYEVARQQSRACENIVKDQHLQHQGWTAIIAYLEDLVHNSRLNADSLHNTYISFIVEREKYFKILKSLEKDMETLSEIPILPILQENLEDSFSSTFEDSTNSNSDQSLNEFSLLDWISAERVKSMADRCTRGLKKYDDNLIHRLKTELLSSLDAANEPNLKELQKVCDRLFSLEQMLKDMRNTLDEQARIASSFRTEQIRISLIKNEKNLFTDTYMLHHDYLVLMLDNQSHLRYIWNQCNKSKEKFTSGIERRLQRVVEVEKMLTDVDTKIVACNDDLTRLCKDLDTLEQVHNAPEMYVAAIVEVVRRKNFSEAFIPWINNLAREMKSLHVQELHRRREFQNKFDGHFLKELFNGLEDEPPAFATEAPEVFDDRLPNLTVEHVRALQDNLPKLNLSFSLLDLESKEISFFYKTVAGEDDETDECNSNVNNSAIQIRRKLNFDETKEDCSENNCSQNFDETKVDCSENNCSQNFDLSTIIESFDDTYRSRTRLVCQRRQGLHMIDEFELLDFETVLSFHKEKIKSLKSLIEEKEAEEKKDHLLELMKKKLAFEEESLKKLQSYYNQMEERKKEARVYEEKLRKEKREIQMLEMLFKRTLDKYDKKTKESYKESNKESV